jgi:putative CocE/NonD family hydrolase
MSEPPIKLFVMGANEWRFENEWPLARTDWQQWYLHSRGHANTLYGDGILSTNQPTNEPPDRYDYDPGNPVPTLGGNNSTWTLMKFAQDQIFPGPIDQRPIERRDDVLCYTSAVLEKDLEVTGPLQVILYAESSARDTDFTAKLVDVYPDGKAIHLAEGIVRARHRARMERVEFLEPNSVAEYRIDLAPTSNVFKVGHRLRVEISSSNFPRFDRCLNTTDDIGFGTQWQIAKQTVLHTSAYPSHIILPVISSQ